MLTLIRFWVHKCFLKEWINEMWSLLLSNSRIRPDKICLLDSSFVWQVNRSNSNLSRLYAQHKSTLKNYAGLHNLCIKSRTETGFAPTSKKIWLNERDLLVCSDKIVQKHNKVLFKFSLVLYCRRHQFFMETLKTFTIVLTLIVIFLLFLIRYREWDP